jgi:hypothetical protein
MQQGWHLPYEVQNWMKEPWVNNVQTDNSDGIDYKRYTDAILARGANLSIAVVTYVDYTRKRASIVYAEKKRTSIPLSNLGIKVKEGTLLELQWTFGTNDDIVVAGARLANKQMLKDISYIQLIEGKILKRETNQFAFIKKGNVQCYIRPETVQKQQLQNNDNVSVLAVLDYNKKKECWNWTCVSLIKSKK